MTNRLAMLAASSLLLTGIGHSDTQVQVVKDDAPDLDKAARKVRHRSHPDLVLDPQGPLPVAGGGAKQRDRALARNRCCHGKPLTGACKPCGRSDG